MKRFYKLAAVQEVPGGFHILLDGKPVKTPAKDFMLAPGAGLADAVMREWAAQGEKLLPDTMPLTQILSTRIDYIGNSRPAVSQAVLKYLDTDLLCYRTAHPPELAAMQAGAWDPPLAWFAEKFGTALQTTTDLHALRQPDAAHLHVRRHVDSLDPHSFTVLHLVTSISGSLVLALALVDGAATAQDVFSAARVEERYKGTLYDEEKYGPDPSQEKKDAAILRDLEAAQRYLELLKI